MNESLWQTAGEELACLALAIWVHVRWWRLQAGVRVQPGPVLGCRFFSSVCCCPQGRLLLGQHECPHCLLQLALVAQTADPRAP